MGELNSDKTFSDPLAQDAQATIKESATIVARANAHLSTFQRLLDSFDDVSDDQDGAVDDSERNFNAVSETAVSGLGIGATPRKEEKKTLETAESKLRKALVGKKKGNDEDVSKRDEEDELVEEKIAVPTPTPKKRKRNTFLDELLAERGGKMKDKTQWNNSGGKRGKRKGA